MSVIQINKPVFFADNGKALKSGYIYIGEPNKSPIDYPIDVTFTDQAGNSYAAQQPLRTNNQGQIQHNGKAILATVNSDYSMLIQDSTQTDITNGYYPLIEVISGAGGDVNLNSYRQYGLVLESLKDLNVTIGETVSNIGRLNADDNLGADWLVISNTGNPADDVDLIDFDNGLQGQRIKNFLGEVETSLDKVTFRNQINVYSMDESNSTFLFNLSQSVSATNLKVTNSERDWVLGRIATSSAGSVGTHAFARNQIATDFAFGSTISGSNLLPISAAGTQSGGSVLSGTWRCLGYAFTSGFTDDARTTLWLRIS